MPYCNIFWHIDAQQNIPTFILFDSLCKVENWEPAYQICYCVLSGRQRKTWNSCCNARPQTSLLQTYGLLTVLNLILLITGYVEYCWWNVFIRNLIKTERWWTEVASNWSVVWHPAKCHWSGDWPMASLPWCMCQSQRKAFWRHAVMCCSTTVNNLLWNLHSVIYFCFTFFNQTWLFKF